MQYTLRYYQNEAVERALYNFKGYKNPFVLVLPTGSGKSLVISELCHRIDAATLILQPSKEILEQNYSKLLSYGILDVGIYSASVEKEKQPRRKKRSKEQIIAEGPLKVKTGRKEIRKYTYATIGSIYKHPELFQQFQYIIMDECHLLNPTKTGMYKKFFKDIDCQHIVGLTATPYRLWQTFRKDGDDIFYTSRIQTLNRIPPFFFKKLAYKISIRELLDQGYLCPLEYKFYQDFDVTNIRENKTGADYSDWDLERFWNEEKLRKLARVIGDIDRECKHNLIFCSSVRQASRCSEMLKEMGYSSDYISSDFNSKDRERIINDFRSGKIKHLCNVGILSIGFDFPPLDCITLARPTLSLALLYQQVGRGFRIDPENPGKVCKIIDITENIKKLGSVETIDIQPEEGGYKDTVVTERGVISGQPLFTFKLKDEKKIAAVLKSMDAEPKQQLPIQTELFGT